MTGVALIPKEKKATTISQFPTISLLHVEGKIPFGVIAERMAECLQRKAYAATSIEKILAYLVLPFSTLPSPLESFLQHSKPQL